ncbi:MAG: hypothetical protein WCS73_01700 [Lentisphaeria bacterium]
MNNLAPFQDKTIDKIRENGGIFHTPAGHILCFPEEFGFCQGVKLAINRLQMKKSQESFRTIHLLGSMIHNPNVNAWFANHGVQISSPPEEEALLTDEFKAENTVYIIPAFGLSLRQQANIERNLPESSEIFDCTCPFVRNVWNIAKREASAGRAIFVHGNPVHQETRAIWSRACKYAKAAALIANPKEADALLIELNKKDAVPDYPASQLHNHKYLNQLKWTLVNQTTMLYYETEAIAEKLRTHCPTSPFSGNGTICSSTHKRQQAAEKLISGNSSMIFVLGGINSSNTIQLYKLAKKQKIVYFIQNPDDVSMDSVKHFDPIEGVWHKTEHWLKPDYQQIGILAGASCPDTQLSLLLKNISNFF